MFYTGRSHRAVLSGRLNSLIKAHQWHTHHGSNLHPQHTSSCNCSSPNHPTHPAGHQDTGHSWTPALTTQVFSKLSSASVQKSSSTTASQCFSPSPSHPLRFLSSWEPSCSSHPSSSLLHICQGHAHTQEEISRSTVQQHCMFLTLVPGPLFLLSFYLNLGSSYPYYLQSFLDYYDAPLMFFSHKLLLTLSFICCFHLPFWISDATR